MLQKDKLRKADIFTGGLIFLFGLWIVTRALKMPMKDSWGGVQNVWFVSPALFPLFVGVMIMILAVLLIRTALREVGFREVRRVAHWLVSSEMVRFLKAASNLRFYAIVVLFFSFVYLNIARIDFFLCSVLFLKVFISMFYFDDESLLRKMLVFYLAGTMFFVVYFLLKLSPLLEGVLPHASDWLALVFMVVYCVYVWRLIRHMPMLRRKYKISLMLSLAVPFLIGPIFKYLLLVPMPTEGLVTAAMDAVWYWDF